MEVLGSHFVGGVALQFLPNKQALWVSFGGQLRWEILHQAGEETHLWKGQDQTLEF